MTEARVPVTVEDREAAAAHIQWEIDYGNDASWISEVPSWIRDGKSDNMELVQAFARHRLAGVVAGREEAAEIAEKCVPGGYMSDRERSYCADHGEDIAAAIRQMGGE